MKIEQFKKEFKNLLYVKFDTLILFNLVEKEPYELFDSENETSVFYDDFDDVLKHKYKGKTIQKWIDDKETLDFILQGGRGAGSGGGSSLFGGQRQDNRNNSTPDLPARMNKMYNGNKMSRENTISNFRKEHATASSEHAIMYDDDGFVSTYIHGNKGSVGFSASQVNGKHMIHNHPSDGWTNFSKADLDSFSSTGMKGLTASSKNVDYTIEKGKNFNSKGFAKALNTAKTNEKNYDKAVDKFLKQNAKKYGYTYKVKKY